MLGPQDRDIDRLDRIIIVFDRALRGLARTDAGPAPEGPAGDIEDDALNDGERRHSVGLMRINHAGEVAAQALYRGQSLVARDPQTRAAMEQAAREESDHLAWCRARLEELDAAPSLLDPLWYAGSLAIGAAAGLAGDRWSLGFVVETERQVVEHLDDHLARLPDGDRRSRAVLERMQADEQSHATRAHAAGGAPLPFVVRRAMRAASKVMTRTAYRI
ncbi:MAG: 2-polyprenyl-3-methyl-6-methoxy-1,4-benzoquinone monooxygenase [Thiotrichales bacterium]|nr:2-polyprenyl-3-methyl-6-methoxy-1,4-benzoquinone monooxygenase [Thiotrichales bacterium]MCY4284622.1 2-polyprenyl-3-methyl-6-methoxy-1,4-benzoquinone monooxygenase [Thiotrichales bacterium]MCY4348308.1 2-polyprenyl-3-methyl-6-methoxy-1,4-benzoquinone monooxygenase [Thiotrichales bacterium]